MIAGAISVWALGVFGAVKSKRVTRQDARDHAIEQGLCADCGVEPIEVKGSVCRGCIAESAW